MVTVCGGAATTRSPRPRLEMLATQCPRLRRLSGRAAAFNVGIAVVGGLRPIFPGLGIPRGTALPHGGASAPIPLAPVPPAAGFRPQTVARVLLISHVSGDARASRAAHRFFRSGRLRSTPHVPNAPHNTPHPPHSKSHPPHNTPHRPHPRTPPSTPTNPTAHTHEPHRPHPRTPPPTPHVPLHQLRPPELLTSPGLLTPPGRERVVRAARISDDIDVIVGSWGCLLVVSTMIVGHWGLPATRSALNDAGGQLSPNQSCQRDTCCWLRRLRR
jgi:hypothetical protein